MNIKVVVLVEFCVWFSISAFSQADTIRWEKLNPLPDSIQRIASGYFLIDSDFYVAGGQIGISAHSVNTVWQYHIPTDTWIKKANLPFGAASTECSFVINGKGYFLTAFDSINGNSCDKKFWEYDATIDSWARKAEFPDSPRINSSCFVYGGKGYVGQTYSCTNWDTHFWQYDPLMNQWTQIATLPPAIVEGSVAIATLPSDAYLFGGLDNNGNFLKDVWRYDIDTDQWVSIGQMPGLSRCYSTFWGFDSVIIGGGGQTSDNNTILKLGSDFYIYNFLSNQWSPVVFQNSFDSTSAGASFIYDRRAYYFGGIASLTPNETFSNQMWSFDASKFIHDTSTGIAEVRNQVAFSVYPNPVNHTQSFSVSTSEGGEILFYDALGRTLDDRKLKQGLNQIKLTTDNEVVFYRATLQYGATENGKVVFIK
jgi:N-acetylneuraminic acid mutarotase